MIITTIIIILIIINPSPHRTSFLVLWGGLAVPLDVLSGEHLVPRGNFRA